MKRPAVVGFRCDACGPVRVEPSDCHVIELPSDAAHDYAFTADCPTCGRPHTEGLSAGFALILAEGGAACHLLPAHPEAPVAGPAFTPDDVLALHEALAQPDWFEQVEDLVTGGGA